MAKKHPLRTSSRAQLSLFATMFSPLLEQHALSEVCHKAHSVPPSPSRSLDQEIGAMLAIAGSSFAGLIACSALLYLFF